MFQVIKNHTRDVKNTKEKEKSQLHQSYNVLENPKCELEQKLTISNRQTSKFELTIAYNHMKKTIKMFYVAINATRNNKNSKFKNSPTN